jgi:hypothetical protein
MCDRHELIRRRKKAVDWEQLPVLTAYFKEQLFMFGIK